MFANGHKLILDRALDALPGSPLSAQYDAMVLGNLREDVYKLPFLRAFTLGKGLTHYYRPGTPWGVLPFVPSAPTRAGWLFDEGVAAWRAGRQRDGAWHLGRAVHLVGEMAAPVHAQRVLHWRGDGFEMYIERHHAELRKLPLPPPPRAESAPQLAHDLAVACQAFPCDRTRNVPGFLGWKLGLLRRPDEAEVIAQARALVPLGAAYTMALCKLFLALAGEPLAEAA